MISELLILQFALQLLGLGDFAHGLVEVILVDCVPVVLDSKQATRCGGVRQDTSRGRCLWDSRFGHDVPQVSTVQPVAHLDDALKVDVTLGDDAGRVDLEDLEAADLVW